MTKSLGEISPGCRRLRCLGRHCRQGYIYNTSMSAKLRSTTFRLFYIKNNSILSTATVKLRW